MDTEKSNNEASKKNTTNVQRPFVPLEDQIDKAIGVATEGYREVLRLGVKLIKDLSVNSPVTPEYRKLIAEYLLLTEQLVGEED